MTIQISILKIEGYGPWTLTLGSDREAQLQILQSQIYGDLQKLFSKKNCLVFFNRFDEYFVVSNTLSIEDHVKIITEIYKMYPDLNLSISIGIGNTPIEANNGAYKARKEKKIFDSPFLIYCNSDNYLNLEKTNSDHRIKILHIDINNSSRIESRLSPYEVTSQVMKIYVMLIDKFLKKKSLTFFLGGDNFMVLADDLKDSEICDLLDVIYDESAVNLNCGIGSGTTSREAAKKATKSLDTIRKLRNEGKILNIYESL
ncbi:MAG TPA: GTP cyclohydrolase IIa [Nitrososphaeraceae archaeon]|nr:GTP cyclohydrolase IIa [Nitrososphaeraceae archaeon]